AIMRHPYLLLRYRLDGVVTLVDAVNGEATLDAHEEAIKQAAVADRIVVTKTDLARGAENLGKLRARLAALNPATRILIAAEGEASAAALLDCGLYDADGKTPRIDSWLNAQAVLSAHEHHDHDHHHADVNRHDAHIRAFCLTSDKPLAPGAFDLFLDLLRQAHGPRLLRVKGIVALSDNPDSPVVIHGVQHVFHPPHRLAAWPDADRRTRIVFIVKDLEERFVTGLYAAFAGEPALDALTPRRSATIRSRRGKADCWGRQEKRGARSLLDSSAQAPFACAPILVRREPGIARVELGPLRIPLGFTLLPTFGAVYCFQRAAREAAACAAGAVAFFTGEAGERRRAAAAPSAGAGAATAMFSVTAGAEASRRVAA